ncbi:MAG: ribonuclease P protein component 4 [Candidatus Methanomethylophilaceae archaeon]|jgi:ribonuclease P protein subunit RPR2
MSKRRISSEMVGDIATERMTTLMRLSKEAVRGGHNDRARRYVKLIKHINQRTRTPMPEDLTFCKSCNVPMMPGVNCKVRIGGHKVKTTCLECKRIRRAPYIREQKE